MRRHFAPDFRNATFATDNPNEAVAVFTSDVAGQVPTVFDNASRRFFVAVITGRNERALDRDLSDFVDAKVDAGFAVDDLHDRFRVRASDGAVFAVNLEIVATYASVGGKFAVRRGPFLLFENLRKIVAPEAGADVRNVRKRARRKFGRAVTFGRTDAVFRFPSVD